MSKSFQLNESLSVLIPAYNEEGNIINVTNQVLLDAKRFTDNFEIVIINDASTDKTAEAVNFLAKTYKNVRVIHNKVNQGLGRSFRMGVKACKNDIILYIEGDGQSLLGDQDKLLEKIKKSDVVLGYRSSRIDYSLFRKTLSYGYLFLFKLFFNLPFKDVNWTQVYRKEVFTKISINSKSPFFVTEAVVKAVKAGFKVTEAPSIYRPREAGSTKLGNIATAYNMFIEMVKLKFGFLN